MAKNKFEDFEEVLDASEFVTNLAAGGAAEIDINLINPNPYQPRFDEEKPELTASIHAAYESMWLSHNADDSLVKPEDGLLQPITITLDPNNEGEYIVTDGHCRLISCKNLDHKTIKYNLVKTSLRELELFALVGNLQRTDLTAFETALAVDNLLKNGFYASAGELAKALGKTAPWISKCRSVLKLSDFILDDIKKNKVKIGLEILVDLQRIEYVDMQEELYTKYKEGKITQSDIRKKIKDLKEELPGQTLKPVFKSSNKTLKLDFNWSGLDDSKQEQFEHEFKNLFDELLDKFKMPSAKQSDIKYIDILENEVYIEYLDNESINISFSKAKELLGEYTSTMIRYSCADNEKSTEFLNSIPNKTQFQSGNLNYLEHKDCR